MENIETIMPTTDVSSYLTALLFDASQKLHIELSKDKEYLLGRLTQEGDQFVYMTLPLLGKAIETSLIREAPLEVPTNFSLVKGTRLPKLFHSLFRRVYDEEGRPKADLCVETVGVLRQACLFYSKVAGNVEHLNQAAIEKFVARVGSCGIRTYHPILRYARKFLHIVFSETAESFKPLAEFEKNPWGRHGPGAVSGGERGAEKWAFKRFPGCPESLFAVNSQTHLGVPDSSLRPAARVVCVPKDFRGPRIICAEPKECQFAQQGLMTTLYRFLEAHYLTREHLDFEDVTRNRLACFDESLATIDLKDASDNLSLELARFLFPKRMFRLLTRYRSSSLKVGDSIVTHRAFATMGSAVCFPVQTLVFLSIVKGVQWYWNSFRRPKDWEKSRIYVFGDDIICARKLAPYVIEVLEASGLVVNREKTALHTLVKESCGEWVLAGTSQVIVKPRTISVTDARSWCAVGELRKTLIEKGWFATAEVADSIRKLWMPKVPKRYNKALQRMEWRVPRLVNEGIVERHKGNKSPLRGEEGLYAFFTHSDTTPSEHGAFVKAKRSWAVVDPYL